MYICTAEGEGKKLHALKYKILEIGNLNFF